MAIARLVLGVLLVSTSALAATVSVPGDYPTVQAAISGAPDGSLIQVADGTYGEALAYDNCDRALTLRGNPDDPSRVVIDATGKGQPVFRVTSCGSNFVVEGITFTGGTGLDGNGGGMFFANSQSIFRRCRFTGNHAGGDGGALFILTSGGVFEECEFTGNTSARFGGAILVHGEVATPSTTLFERCTISGNEAGVIEPGWGWGGGVYVTNSSPTFLGCTISNNHGHFAGGGAAVLGLAGSTTEPIFRDTLITGNVVDPAAPANEGQGGGLHIERDARVTLDRVLVQGNHANGGGGLSSYLATYDIVDSVIADNVAALNTAPVAGGWGGGLLAISVIVPEFPWPVASHVTLTRTVFRNNQAQWAGGMLVQGDFMGLTSNRAVLTMTDSIVAGNVALDYGGGILLDRADATIAGSHVIGNQAQTAWGAGILGVGSSSMRITDGVFAGNHSVGLGAAMMLDQGSHLEVEDARFVGNVADHALGGSAIGVTDAAGPSTTQATGWVRNSYFHQDGGTAEIFESSCNTPSVSAITYDDNRFSGPADVYSRNCHTNADSPSDFNAIGGGKASRNASGGTAFAKFLAAPTTIVSGQTSTLSWAMTTTRNRSIDEGIGDLGDLFGTTGVSPDTTTTYDLLDDGATLASATVTVTCAGLGTPIATSPTNGDTRVAPGAPVLAWYAASGATSYDVYLDTADSPSTLVASGLAGTSFAPGALAPSTRYRWRVVAQSPACAAPSPSPVFSFTTCSSDACDFEDDFGDGDASDWTPSGKGSSVVTDGRLILTGKPRLRVLAPTPAQADGTFTVALELLAGKQVRLLTGVADNAHYRELIIKNGRWKLRARDGRKRRTVGSARRALNGVATIAITTAGTTMSVSVDGTNLLGGDTGNTSSGQVGIVVIRSSVAVDDVLISHGG